MRPHGRPRAPDPSRFSQFDKIFGEGGVMSKKALPAQSENKQLAAAAASLKDQIAALEGQKAELDKALAAGKETEASYQKKVRGLNGSIAGLKKKAAEMEALIASKEAEIGTLRQNEAA